MKSRLLTPNIHGSYFDQCDLTALPKTSEVAGANLGMVLFDPLVRFTGV